MMVGTKSSDIFTLRLGDDFSRATKLMSGHSEGNLWTVAIET